MAIQIPNSNVASRVSIQANPTVTSKKSEVASVQSGTQSSTSASAPAPMTTGEKLQRASFLEKIQQLDPQKLDTPQKATKNDDWWSNWDNFNNWGK